MKEKLEQIVGLVSRYPSGDNCQPFTFSISGNQVDIHFDHEIGRHTFNFKEVATSIAFGCLLESFHIAASGFGLEVSEDIDISKKNRSGIIGSVAFQENPSLTGDSLFEFLEKRCVDRRPYNKGDLSTEFYSEIDNIDASTGRASVHVTQNLVGEFCDYIVDSEEILWWSQPAVDDLMHWVRLTYGQAQSTRDGLYWQNLGIKGWQLPTMAQIKKMPSSLKMIRPLGFVSMSRAFSKKLVDSSAAFILFTVDEGSDLAEVDLGRIAMRTWLSLTGINFGVQPTSLPVLPIYGLIRYGWNKGLPDRYVPHYQKGEQLIRKHFALKDNQLPAWMVRTGASTPLPDKMRTFRRELLRV